MMLHLGSPLWFWSVVLSAASFTHNLTVISLPSMKDAGLLSLFDYSSEREIEEGRFSLPSRQSCKEPVKSVARKIQNDFIFIYNNL